MDTKAVDPSVSSLYTLTTGSVASFVGDIYSGTKTPDINDIAYDAFNTKMYAITANRLWTLDYLNPSSGKVAASAVGPVDNTTNNWQGLEVVGGTIYMGPRTTGTSGTTSGSLYTLDPSTGTATLKGSFGTWSGNVIGQEGDLAYGNGQLYATMNWAGNGHGGTYLAIIDASSGTATKIDRTGYYTGTTFHAVNLDGIVFVDGILYGTTRGDATTPAELFTINDSNVAGH